MKIRHTEPQFNNIETNASNQTSSTVVSTVRNLSKQEGIPDVLALTHRAVGQQIQDITQETQLALNDLQKQLRTLKDAGFFQTDTASIINTIAAHTALTTIKIISANNQIHNLETLKNRDFRPTKAGALIIPFSGKALGGMDRRTNMSASSKSATEIKNLKTQQKDLGKKITKWTKDIETLTKRRSTFQKKGDEAGVAGLNFEIGRLSQALTLFHVTLAEVEQNLKKHTADTDVGCSSRWMG